MNKRRVGVLISGRGSNMAALIEAAAAPDYPAEIVRVVSSNPTAAGLERARAAGIATEVIDARGQADRNTFETAVETSLNDADAEIVCLAGFMRLLSEGFVERWRDRIINIHPSLLPAFQGLNTHIRAIEAGVKLTGCTVHYVRATMDDGPIIAQAAVPVLADDTAETLAVRVLAAEHRLYPRALALVAAGRARVVDERVMLDDLRADDTPGVLMSPASL